MRRATMFDPKRCFDSGEHWRNAIYLSQDTEYREDDDPDICWICPICKTKANQPLKMGAAA